MAYGYPKLISWSLTPKHRTACERPSVPLPCDRLSEPRTAVPAARDEPHDRAEAARRGSAQEVQARDRALESLAQRRVAVHDPKIGEQTLASRNG